MNIAGIEERLKKQLEFMVELDKMKNLYRQTYVLHEDRKENDAEHSFHLAIMAFLLAEYSAEPVNVEHVIRMVLLHDVVEIDAGDTYCYDTEANKTKAEREENAAQRIFGILPDDQKKEYYDLWREFEDSETPEARFAAMLDRLQPLMLNYLKGGISWKEHGAERSWVEERNARYRDVSEELSKVVSFVIEDGTKKGWLRDNSRNKQK